MRIIKLLLFLLISLNLNAKALTESQLDKLKKPMITIHNNTYILEEYNLINLKKEQLFLGEKIEHIIIKQISIMKEDVIHKELFIGLSTTIFDQIINSILTPDLLDNIENTTLFIDKPSISTLHIELNFVQKGIHVNIKSTKEEENYFIYYSQIFKH